MRVNDPHDTTADETGTTWVFSYDRGGNITSKTCYVYTTDTLGWPQDTIQYAYGDTNWKDKLTSYDNRSFSYDAIGNPTSDGIWSYEWEVGRRLKSMNADGGALCFKYDHNGLRTQKVVQLDWYPTTYNYLLHGKLITHMTVDYTDWDEVAQKDVLHFFYDAQSRPAKVSFNGVIYWKDVVDWAGIVYTGAVFALNKAVKAGVVVIAPWAATAMTVIDVGFWIYSIGDKMEWW